MSSNRNRSTRSTLDALQAAHADLRRAQTERRSAETASRKADVALARAQEVEAQAIASYKAARAAALKAYPEVAQTAG